MSETKIIRLTRVFKMGSVRLPDPDPDLSPEEALRLYTANYPHLAHATLAEPRSEGTELVYEIEKPPAKTKGASRA